MTAAVMRSRCGVQLDLDVDRWHRPADPVELDLLDTLPDPLIDVGCGPGRIVEAVAARGRIALGVDVSDVALARARGRDAAVLARSVFDPIPGERRWRSLVLFDGNIGIGGDPVALLGRARELLAPGGVVLAEVEAPGVGTQRLDVRVEVAGGLGPWFAWARVGADDVGRHAAAAGLGPVRVERHGDRWFARTTRP